MNSSHTTVPFSRLTAFAAGALLATGLATAQFTPISGNLSGTLAPGVYHTTGNLQVQSGQTLTLQAGVIIKFVGARQFNVQGTLISNGTATNPVIFTDDADDTAGGDTNGNGPSTGVSGSWYNLAFGGGSDSSTLTYTEVRYAGYANYAAVNLNGADISVSHGTIRDCNRDAFYLNTNSFPTISDCSVLNNGGKAFDLVPLHAVVNITNNIAAGNALNCLRITNGTVSSNLALDTQSMHGGAFLLAHNLTVQAGVTLTVPAGVNIKFEGARQVNVVGTLDCQGTAANPVIFTDDADDTAGGDTNGDGPSAGVSASWYNLAFGGASDSSTLTYTEVRYAGYANYAAVNLNGADISVSHGTIRDCNRDAFYLNTNSFPTISDCSVLNNGGKAFDLVPLHAVVNITNNIAAGNALNCLRITNGTVSSNLALDTQSMHGGAFLLAHNLTVQAGVTLTVPAGVNIKFEGARQVNVVGTLDCQGTAANPVIFTDDADDTAGGDTNGDGPSAGVSASWYNLAFGGASDSSTLTYTEVRYAGYANYAAVNLNGADISVSHCTIRDCNRDALYLNTNSFPSVTDCTLANNGGRSVELVPIAAIPGFVNNTAIGNGLDCMRITQATVSSSLRLGTQSMLAGAFILATNMSVAATGDLTVEQGVVFKLEGARQVSITGTATFRGTAYEPIVFTDDADDSIGGDSNGNGNGSGVPGAWYNIDVGTSAVVLLENVTVRYGGFASYPALNSTCNSLTMRSVRIDEAYADGFYLSDVGPNPTNLVAWSCGRDGISLANGSFDLLHATTAGNGRDGISAASSWSGYVINSNSYGNTNDFTGLLAAEVLKSNGGFAGSNGNIQQDPLFVDLATGDLHLGLGSPCLGAADPAFALLTLKDADENSRILDHALSGAMAPDMGAYERGNWHMNVNGTPRPGETVFLTMQGLAGDSFLGFGLMDGSMAITPYGILTAGMPGGAFSLVFPFSIPVGTPIPLTVPNDPTLAGIIIGMQALNLPNGSLLTGNFSELYRVLVRP